MLLTVASRPMAPTITPATASTLIPDSLSLPASAFSFLAVGGVGCAARAGWAGWAYTLFTGAYFRLVRKESERICPVRSRWLSTSSTMDTGHMPKQKVRMTTQMGIWKGASPRRYC